METFEMKTYADSYLYNAYSKSTGKSINKAINDFIIKSHRIDKNEPAFSGIVEEIKRHQSSPVLLSVLFNDNVVLCIGDVELPIAFKVFDAKDSKNNKKSKVFIDLTGRIEYKNGYFVIKRNEADKICALLFDALIYLLYRYQRFKLTNNPNIVLVSTRCYVSMFNYILDYLRIIGFSQNRDRISYLTALYYLHGMIGYNLDDPYTKNIASKVANISLSQAKAFDYFIDDEEMFDNIGTYIPSLTSIFKLKQLDLSVFINRWTNSFGTGTEYATELFTSFLVTLVNAYTGSYIIRQRQIETACGDANLVKIANAIIHAGNESYDIRSEGTVNFDVHSEESQKLNNAICLKLKILSEGLMIDRYDNIESVKESANNIINVCKEARIESNIEKFAKDSIINGINIVSESTWSVVHGEDPDYYPGSLSEAVKSFSKYIKEGSRNEIITLINNNTNYLSELVQEYSNDLPKSIKSEAIANITELYSIKNLL